MSVKLYIQADDRLVDLSDIATLENLVRELEADDELLTCPICIEGGRGSTLLNFMLPDFTPEEERALIDFLHTACTRTIEEGKASIQVAERRMAELKGFKVLEGQKKGEPK